MDLDDQGSKMITFESFWPLLKKARFFEAAGAVENWLVLKTSWHKSLKHTV
jgi:hypothetical protein